MTSYSSLRLSCHLCASALRRLAEAKEGQQQQREVWVLAAAISEAHAGLLILDWIPRQKRSQPNIPPMANDTLPKPPVFPPTCLMLTPPAFEYRILPLGLPSPRASKMGRTFLDLDGSQREKNAILGG